MSCGEIFITQIPSNITSVVKGEGSSWAWARGVVGTKMYTYMYLCPPPRPLPPIPPDHMEIRWTGRVVQPHTAQHAGYHDKGAGTRYLKHV